MRSILESSILYQSKVVTHHELVISLKHCFISDLIAVPDFGAGAMENWGLITYRETSLLFSEGQSSSKAQEWVAIVVAHELAHQWFGNLVTMQWWNDLWLNEGFASWMEYKGVNQIKPDWSMMEQFWTAKLLPALQLDSLASSHPVSVPVKDPKEIEAIFDTISYKKGSSIIYMLEGYMGQDDLRSGLEKYLSQHKFENAVTKDLWSCLSSASKQKIDVESMMNTWTLQMGYPLITFSKIEGGKGWSIEQSRFLALVNLNGSDLSQPPSKYNYSWSVPVNFKTDKNDVHHVFLQHNSNNSNINMKKMPDNIKWIKANLNGTGYYRVMYPEDIWKGLTAQLKDDHLALSAVDRAQLLDDAFSLMKAGHLSETIPLEMSTYLTKEKSLVVWRTAIHHLASLSELLRETDARDDISNYIRGLLQPIYDDLGWEDKGTHVQRLLREDVLKAAAEADHKEALTKAKALFIALKKNDSSVPANLRSLVYSVGIRTGDEVDWSWCYEKYISTNIPSERSILLSALGDSNNVLVLQR